MQNLLLFLLMAIFSLNLSAQNPRKWMFNIRNDVSIAALSIPGTHDSGADYGCPTFAYSAYAKCQDWSISEQLNAGIRFLDIRCRRVGSSFAIHHGHCYQQKTFDDVLRACQKFLQDNPSETILMNIQEEHEASSNTSFTDILAGYKDRYPIWHPSTDEIPTIGEVRGQIVEVGTNGGNVPIDMQNEYHLRSVGEKWPYVENHLDRAKSNTSNSNIFINHLTANGLSSDALDLTVGFFGGLPTPKNFADDCIPKLGRYLERSSNQTGRYGVLIMDFPNNDIISQIIRSNSSSLYNRVSSESWIRNYGKSAGGWLVGRNPRVVGDVTGDGKDDIVGFSNSTVKVSPSTGKSFSAPQNWSNEFINSWSTGSHIRTLGDVNGDGKEDLVGFANAGVYVALSNGQKFNRGSYWIRDFGKNAGGWQVGKNPRVVGDVNGDGKDDIVGFSNSTVKVSLSTGSSFSTPQNWSNEFINSWSTGSHIRTLGDVNGDGKEDLVGFANAGVYVALSNGRKFNSGSYWIRDFGKTAGWTIAYPRTMADVNGDGKDDIVGFGPNGVMVALSTGTRFRQPVRWTADFAQTWSITNHIRTTGDVNGDGQADIVGFANAGVRVLRSQQPLR